MLTSGEKTIDLAVLAPTFQPLYELRSQEFVRNIPLLAPLPLGRGADRFFDRPDWWLSQPNRNTPGAKQQDYYWLGFTARSDESKRVYALQPTTIALDEDLSVYVFASLFEPQLPERFKNGQHRLDLIEDEMLAVTSFGLEMDREGDFYFDVVQFQAALFGKRDQKDYLGYNHHLGLLDWKALTLHVIEQLALFSRVGRVAVQPNDEREKLNNVQSLPRGVRATNGKTYQPQKIDHWLGGKPLERLVRTTRAITPDQKLLTFFDRSNLSL